jgi:hypothetical protein
MYNFYDINNIYGGIHKMSYQPKVVEAEIVDRNEENGAFDIIVKLSDNNVCRLSCSTDKVSKIAKADYVNRTYKVPCAICMKDYLCHCFNAYKTPLFTQAIKIAKK